MWYIYTMNKKPHEHHYGRVKPKASKKGKLIEKAVKKAMKDYGEVFKRLAAE